MNKNTSTYLDAARFLAATQDQMRAEVERAGVFGERAAIDEFGARLRQHAFIERGKVFVEFLREDELQHGVAEKFQPLIVFARHAAFVRDGRMCEREAQKIFVAKIICKTFLKFSRKHFSIISVLSKTQQDQL